MDHMSTYYGVHWGGGYGVHEHIQGIYHSSHEQYTGHILLNLCMRIEWSLSD